MPCPTCSHTLASVALRVFHCERCGTVVQPNFAGPDHVTVPKLVVRVGMLQNLMTERVGFSRWDQEAWTQIGLFECIQTEDQRRAT